MTETRFLARFATIANAAFNSMTANSTAVTAMSIGGHTINSSSMSAATNTFTVGTAAYFVANGNLGIGTATPISPLSIVDKTAAGSGIFAIDVRASNSSFDTSVGITTYGVASGYFVRRAGGTAASPTATQLGDRLGFFIGSTTPDGNTFFNTTIMEMFAEATANSTSQPTSIRFATTAVGATSRTERMRITANGDVGIGTSAPGVRLDVNGIVRAQGSVAVEAGDPEGGRLRIINTTKTGNTTFDWSIWNMTGGYGNGLTFWRYYGNGTNAGVAMYLADNGNVGIGTGTGSPATRLHVTTSGSNGTDGILLSGGATTRSVILRPSMGAGNNNGIVQAGDSGIIFDGGSVDTGAFVIAPWASVAGGMRMDSTGRIRLPTQPGFYAYGTTGNQVLGNQGDLILDGVAYNVGGHYNNTNYRFTAPIAGRYLFTWSVFITGVAGRCSLKVNGGAYWNTQMDVGASMSQSSIISLQANDYVTVGDWQNISGMNYWAGHSHFSGILLA